MNTIESLNIYLEIEKTLLVAGERRAADIVEGLRIDYLKDLAAQRGLVETHA